MEATQPGPGTIGVVTCDRCGHDHVGRYSHEATYRPGAVYAVLCPVTGTTDNYHAARVRGLRPDPKAKS